MGRTDLFLAEEAFLTGSGAGVIGIRSLDSRPIGDGQRGLMTEKLAELHCDLIQSEGDAIV
jgi:branched-chain amino acid aminotransferase